MATETAPQSLGDSAASTTSNVDDEKKTPAKERPPVMAGPAGLQLTSLDDIFRMADWIANSDFVPKDYRGKVENCVVPIEYGMELGLQPMSAIQNIAVVNGRPTLWGDAVPALCMKRVDLFDHSKYRCFMEGTEGTDDWAAVCECRRIGAEVTRRTFSVKDAKKASLWGKGTYSSYPAIMLMNRARTFALRHAFPDVLKGMHTADEIDPALAAERALANIDEPATNAALRAAMSKPKAEPPKSEAAEPDEPAEQDEAPPPEEDVDDLKALKVDISRLIDECDMARLNVADIFKTTVIAGRLKYRKCEDVASLTDARDALRAALMENDPTKT